MAQETVFSGAEVEAMIQDKTLNPDESETQAYRHLHVTFVARDWAAAGGFSLDFIFEPLVVAGLAPSFNQVPGKNQATIHLNDAANTVYSEAESKAMVEDSNIAPPTTEQDAEFNVEFKAGPDGINTVDLITAFTGIYTIQTDFVPTRQNFNLVVYP